MLYVVVVVGAASPLQKPDAALDAGLQHVYKSTCVHVSGACNVLAPSKASVSNQVYVFFFVCVRNACSISIHSALESSVSSTRRELSLAPFRISSGQM